jgi:nicotinamide-nucleotide amidase
MTSLCCKVLKALEGKSLVTAESCTGGGIGAALTVIPGSSEVYKGGVICYTSWVKENVLGVPHEIIAQHGAVSKECVEAMALGVNRVMNTDFAVATSGIAGPGGGSPEKPVGTAWLAVAFRDKETGKVDVVSKKVAFNSSREVNIDRFASNALNLLRLYLESH